MYGDIVAIQFLCLVEILDRTIFYLALHTFQVQDAKITYLETVCEFFWCEEG